LILKGKEKKKMEELRTTILTSRTYKTTETIRTFTKTLKIN